MVEQDRQRDHNDQIPHQLGGVETHARKHEDDHQRRGIMEGRGEQHEKGVSDETAPAVCGIDEISVSVQDDDAGDPAAKHGGEDEEGENDEEEEDEEEEDEEQEDLKIYNDEDNNKNLELDKTSKNIESLLKQINYQKCSYFYFFPLHLKENYLIVDDNNYVITFFYLYIQYIHFHI